MQPKPLACIRLVRAMSEAGESSAEEAERPPELQYVLAGSTLNYDYEIGALAVGDGEARRTISVILVAPFEERMLAIFPSKAWDKKPNKRKLPSGRFTKPVLVEVACASLFDQTTLSSEGPAKVWFGMLARQLQSALALPRPTRLKPASEPLSRPCSA